MTGEAFYESELYEELCELTHKLDPWYNIGRVTWYVVYVYSKDDMNLFDIWGDELNIFDEDHAIPDEAMEVIHEIQEKLKEINRYLEEG